MVVASSESEMCLRRWRGEMGLMSETMAPFV